MKHAIRFQDSGTKGREEEGEEQEEESAGRAIGKMTRWRLVFEG